MKIAALLRHQLETVLTARMPAALSPRGRAEPERLSCGITALDKLLLGGLPAGVLTELVGPESSGRTTVALSLLAGITQTERVAAWIDIADALDPATAAANGVDLERLLWVRCGAGSDYILPVFVKPSANGVSLPSADSSPRPPQGGGSPHPRSEGRGMPQAISAMLQAHGGLYDKHARRDKKAIGTPGVSNRPLIFRSADREEQIPSDRLPVRRGEHIIAPRCAEPLQERRREIKHSEWTTEIEELFSTRTVAEKRPWDVLDQALRTADLLLQGGGFSVIVLDLGSTPAEMAWRIPLATWFRFRAACERTRVSLLLLTRHPCARSSAELVVRMAAGRMEAQSKVMTGIAYRAEGERQRFQNTDNIVSIRRPPQSEHGRQWKGEAPWAINR